jgi:hypothetical protein
MSAINAGEAAEIRVSSQDAADIAAAVLRHEATVVDSPILRAILQRANMPSLELRHLVVLGALGGAAACVAGVCAAAISKGRGVAFSMHLNNPFDVTDDVFAVSIAAAEVKP